MPEIASTNSNTIRDGTTHIAGNTQGARWPGPLWGPAAKIGSDSQPAAACKKPAIISSTRIFPVVNRRHPDGHDRTTV
jgi:hypothetical protein